MLRASINRMVSVTEAVNPMQARDRAPWRAGGAGSFRVQGPAAAIIALRIKIAVNARPIPITASPSKRKTKRSA
jgi:hypothetical protein